MQNGINLIYCRAILSNSKALNESIQNLKKFQTFMNLLVDANDGLLRNERFLLKIVRLKFELDTCLRSLENYATLSNFSASKFKGITMRIFGMPKLSTKKKT